MKNAIVRLWVLVGLATAVCPLASQGRDAGPADGAALLDKGRQQIAQGQLDEAVRTLTLAREAVPSDPAVYNALADVYEKQGVEPMAVMQLEKSLAVDSTQIDTRLRLADIHSRNRRWNEAGHLYQDVLRRDPQNDAAALLLGHLYQMAKQPAPAAKALAGYVGRHPGDEHVALEYLDAAAASGQDAAAAGVAESILNSKPDWPPALLAAARSRARLGQNAVALEHYRHLETLRPLAGDDAFAVGHCYVAQHDDASASTWFERALRDSLDARSDWAEPAAVFMRLKRWPEAAGLYERRVSQDSTAASAWMNLALCRQQTKEFAAARRALLRAASLRPDDVRSRYALATTYVLMDSIRAARRQYEAVIRLAGANEDTYRDELRQSYRYLSTMDLVDKNWQAALSTLDKALHFEPQDIELRLYRAQALFAVNRKAEAKQEFQTVLQMQPGNKEAKKGLDLVARYN